MFSLFCQVNYMVSIREISDNNSTISSTRWGFAIVIKFDIFMIFLTFVAYLVCLFLNKPLGNELFSGVSVLLGILTGLVTTTKTLQGFEPHNKEVELEAPKEEPKEVETKPVEKNNSIRD